MSDLQTFARIAPSLALRPWERRVDEPVDDWLAFLAWLLTRPRAPVIPEGARDAAVQWDWLSRASMSEHALAPRDDPRQIAEQIVRNALGTLHRGMAHHFARSDTHPEEYSLADLLKLFAQVTALESRLPQADAEGQSWLDTSKLTKDEAAQLAYLMSKAVRAHDDRG